MGGMCIDPRSSDLLMGGMCIDPRSSDLLMGGMCIDPCPSDLFIALVTYLSVDCVSILALVTH
jgi:hypothetical protein